MITLKSERPYFSGGPIFGKLILVVTFRANVLSLFKVVVPENNMPSVLGVASANGNLIPMMVVLIHPI